MRKVKIVSFLFILAFILIAGVVGSNQANAVVCPAGLICIPKSSAPADCPSGLICVPNPTYVKPVASTDTTYACYRFSSDMGWKGIYESVSMGADVANLQRLLISKGYDIPSITKANTPAGSFDEDTRNAVMKYQESKGIPTTGFAGPLTRASLNSSCLISSGTSPSPTPSAGAAIIKVLSPNGGEVLKEGSQFRINWTSANIPANSQIIVDIFNSSIADIKYPNHQIAVLSSNATSYSWTVSGNNGWGMGKSSIYQKLTNVFGVKNADAFDSQYVISVRAYDPVTYKQYAYDQSDSGFKIVSSNAASIKVLSPREGDRWSVGSTYTISWQSTSFPDGAYVYLNGGGREEGYSKYIGKTSGDSLNYVVTSADLPLNSWNTWRIAVCNGVLQNGGNDCAWSGQIFVSSLSASPSPTPTNTPAQPSMSFTYPRYAETWYLGETKNVSWTYNNFDSSVSGEKYVELQLVPLDGRSPIVLGTYTAPYGYQPLTIYTKTTTGRDAWLPGEYKLKLVCRSSNVNGFKNCRADAVGYITVKAPNPSPTSSPVSVNPNNDLNAAIWSAVEEYSRGR